MSALSDAIVAALQDFLRVLFSPVTRLIQDHADGLVRTIVGTPHPNAVFAAPTNAPWPRIYSYYWDASIPLSLSLWGLAIGLVIFLESTNHLFSGYHRTNLKRRAVTGLFGILAWWWLAAISLRFIEALTGYLVPDLSDVALFQTLSFSALGVLGVVVTLTVDLIVFVLIALIYFVRQVVLYLFVLLMPVLIALWIPGVGPFALVSGFVKRLAGFYVPFLFMTVPVAVLFRLGELLGSSVSLSMGGLGLWLTALVIPIVAVLSPFVLFWQAGALFFTADRVAYHGSMHRGRARVQRTRAAGQATMQGGRNFARGVRGDAALRGDGQTVFQSGDSRAHRAGVRVGSTRDRFRTGGGATNRWGGEAASGGADAGGSGQQGSGGHRGSPGADRSNTGSSTPALPESRESTFENLRGRARSAGPTRDDGVGHDDTRRPPPGRSSAASTHPDSDGIGNGDQAGSDPRTRRGDRTGEGENQIGWENQGSQNRESEHHRAARSKREEADESSDDTSRER